MRGIGRRYCGVGTVPERDVCLSQEFLAFLLDGLHEELNRVVVKHYVEDPDVTADDLSHRKQERLAAEAWSRYLQRNKSFLVDIFQGQIRSSVKCAVCNIVSLRFEPFMYLTLPVPDCDESHSASVEDCLRDYVAWEECESSSWTCPRCKCFRPFLKRIELWKTPPILIVHLKRFEFRKDRFRKIESHVRVPIDSYLNLRPFLTQKSLPIYDCFGVINHRGRYQFGHYTACCKHSHNRWREFDDDVVRETASSSISSRDNYVLFFQRKDLCEGTQLVKRQTLTRPEDWPHFNSSSLEDIHEYA
eukprot:Polyplicarium_translucidae@DN3373_c0_g2_i2.p1